MTVRLARAYGRLVVVLAALLVVARFVVDPGSELTLLAVGVLALAVAGLSVLWIRTELALIHDIRHNREVR